MNQEVYGVGIEPVPGSDPIVGVDGSVIPLSSEVNGSNLLNPVSSHDENSSNSKCYGWDGDYDGDGIPNIIDFENGWWSRINGSADINDCKVATITNSNDSSETTISTLPDGFTVDYLSGEVILPNIEGLVEDVDPNKAYTEYIQDSFEGYNFQDPQSLTSFKAEALTRFLGYLQFDDLSYNRFEPSENGTGINLTTMNGISPDVAINHEVVDVIIDALEIIKATEERDGHISDGIILLTLDEQTDGRNIIDGREVSMSAASPEWNAEFGNASIGLSSVIITGNTFKDLSALGTEISQLYHISKNYIDKDMEAESISNSFGMGVACAWYGVSYDEYLYVMNAPRYFLADGTEIEPTPVDRGVYELLQARLINQPDLFIKREE